MMMSSDAAIPLFPRVGALLLAPLPLFPIAIAAQWLAQSLARRHPGLFARLDTQADKAFLIDPTDLPFVFRLLPRPEQPQLEVLRREHGLPYDARIAAPLAALIGMLHGAFDGDALFFSRDMVIEGDTEAVLALRNALDDAEIDLAVEIAAVLGPLGPLVETSLRGLAGVAGRLTGVALSRAQWPAP
jgi:predicted lipid carrier protein YhbT